VLLHTSFGFGGGFVSPSVTKIITCAGQTTVLADIASVIYLKATNNYTFFDYSNVTNK
jgi:hypothetical protein